MKQADFTKKKSISPAKMWDLTPETWAINSQRREMDFQENGLKLENRRGSK